MSNRSYLSFCPVFRSGDEYTVISVGSPVLLEGEKVDVFDGTSRREIRDLKVFEVDTFPVRETPEDLLETIGHRDVDALVRHLSAVHKTAFSLDTQISVYWMVEIRDAEETFLFPQADSEIMIGFASNDSETPDFEPQEDPAEESPILEESEEKPAKKKKSKS